MAVRAIQAIPGQQEMHAPTPAAHRQYTSRTMLAVPSHDDWDAWIADSRACLELPEQSESPDVFHRLIGAICVLYWRSAGCRQLNWQTMDQTGLSIRAREEQEGGARKWTSPRAPGSLSGAWTSR